MPRKPKPRHAKSEVLVAKALRSYAYILLNSSQSHDEDIRELDRALRSCRGISDIDTVWVRWSYMTEKYGLDTSKEAKWDSRKKGFYYPDTDPEVPDEP